MEGWITILSDYLPIGDVLRLRRCNIKLKYLIENSNDIWGAALQAGGYSIKTHRKTLFNTFVEKCNNNKKTCRECGHRRVITPMLTSNLKNVNVCNKCIKIQGSYCYTMTRKEIQTFISKRALVKFTKKYSSVLQLLPTPRNKRNKEYLYWANDVYKIIET